MNNNDDMAIMLAEFNELGEFMANADDDAIRAEHGLVSASDSPPAVEIVDDPQQIHRRICRNFGVIETAFYDICKDLNSIRDGKSYIKLGYSTFEKYCKEEFGISRDNAYRYISIAENLTEDFVAPVQQIGLRKLTALSKLDELQRTELLNIVDINSISARDLEKKVREIKKQSKANKEFGNKQVLTLRDVLADNFDSVKYIDSILIWYRELANCIDASINVPIDVDNYSIHETDIIKQLQFISQYSVNMSKCCNNLLLSMGADINPESPKPNRTSKIVKGGN